MLIKCPDCGKHISDMAKTCIYCGRPIAVLRFKDYLLGAFDVIWRKQYSPFYAWFNFCGKMPLVPWIIYTLVSTIISIIIVGHMDGLDKTNGFESGFFYVLSCLFLTTLLLNIKRARCIAPNYPALIIKMQIIMLIVMLMVCAHGHSLETSDVIFVPATIFMPIIYYYLLFSSRKSTVSSLRLWKIIIFLFFFTVYAAICNHILYKEMETERSKLLEDFESENLLSVPEYVSSYTIPDGVKTIGNKAFAGCKFLTSITIPNSVTSIGARAFENCESLTSVTIPNSVASIGEGVFTGCSKLTSITISDSVTSIGDKASAHVKNENFQIDYAGCLISLKEKKIIYAPRNLRSYVISDGITSIGGSAFEFCKSLTSVTIPNSVTSIGERAFLGCIELTSITIPNNVTRIGSIAFLWADCEKQVKRDYPHLYK